MVPSELPNLAYFQLKFSLHVPIYTHKQELCVNTITLISDFKANFNRFLIEKLYGKPFEEILYS